MSNKGETVVLCYECGEQYQMAHSSFERLEKDNAINCDKCRAIVELEICSARPLWHVFIVFYFGLGSLIVAIVALGNIFGYVGFSTYFVSTPFILSMFLIASLKKSQPIKLVVPAGEKP